MLSIEIRPSLFVKNKYNSLSEFSVILRPIIGLIFVILSVLLVLESCHHFVLWHRNEVDFILKYSMYVIKP